MSQSQLGSIGSAATPATGTAQYCCAAGSDVQAGVSSVQRGLGLARAVLRDCVRSHCV